ncbi:hypothetical protein CNBC6270 [Cryptococcus deneoformans B-3501A]|uniref:ATP synthase subunit 4 n=1 Tax=Cryptococcus deneoformans (strain JEC21 / ATCC MYA-565) TaxID=214684 RepID=Q5KL26_CRYD1|nr:ATP synthase, putative [Cryptococcus neoformans var. neoformans JEC21]XP_776236.1 hypothetical protein CNBC6270 [Cryptococcus neoformans var. neoformans B-3501A]AAW42110.1 ATP synthase, putative [Cryptococcus neoformans var. neoformans JEC21]EAL21589.1 hypothetical protein CNBC6270 [Cryptococcus neoformans var. neoformans B-3501A]
MASRFAIKSLRSAAIRPAIAPRAVVAQSARFLATQPTPDEKAASIINSVPSSSLFTKTGGVILGTGLTAAAVSSELYVANEETVLLVGFLVIATVIGKSVSAPYAEWANGQIEKVKSILNSAREEHTRAVTDRIDSVGQLKEVVPLTESLYAVAKETNKLEHENFILAQENAVKAELKSVLDSWVRYEQQQREAEQIALVKTVQANVEAELAKPAFKKQLLEEALAQVEQIAKSKAI